MPIEVETLSISQLDNLIENHRRKRATNAPLYIDPLRELGKRKGKGLDFDKSLSIILEAAAEPRFLSYIELAKASGGDWNQVRFAMNGHLWDLVEYSHLRYGILFSAVVVNTANVATGKIEPETLKGFTGAARELGYLVTDEQAFLKEQQGRVFAWAQRGPAPASQQ
jgi:hypothetical protein